GRLAQGPGDVVEGALELLRGREPLVHGAKQIDVEEFRLLSDHRLKDVFVAIPAETLLAAEVMDDEGRADAGVVGDGSYRGGREAVRSEEADGSAAGARPGCQVGRCGDRAGG